MKGWSPAQSARPNEWYAGTMSTVARRLHYTYRQYLDALAMSEIKLEFLDGEIFAMAGGTPEHGTVAASLIRLLGNAVPHGCRVFNSDVKIRVLATGFATSPDVSVVCGELERALDDSNAITNPALLAEVLSPSTEEYDRGEKLRHYLQIPSLRAVLHLAHDARRVTVVRRVGDAWETTEHDREITLDAPAVRVDVGDVYRPLDLP